MLGAQKLTRKVNLLTRRQRLRVQVHGRPCRLLMMRGCEGGVIAAGSILGSVLTNENLTTWWFRADDSQVVSKRTRFERVVVKKTRSGYA